MTHLYALWLQHWILYTFDVTKTQFLHVKCGNVCVCQLNHVSLSNVYIFMHRTRSHRYECVHGVSEQRACLQIITTSKSWLYYSCIRGMLWRQAMLTKHILQANEGHKVWKGLWAEFGLKSSFLRRFYCIWQFLDAFLLSTSLSLCSCLCLFVSKRLLSLPFSVLLFRLALSVGLISLLFTSVPMKQVQNTCKIPQNNSNQIKSPNFLPKSGLFYF